MKLLINIFGGMVFSIPVLAIIGSVSALVDFLASRVNWSLVLVLGLSALFIVTFIKRKK